MANNWGQHKNENKTPELSKDNKIELKYISMIYIEQCSRMSEKSPAMKTAIVNNLNFDGMAEYGNYILLLMMAKTLTSIFTQKYTYTNNQPWHAPYQTTPNTYSWKNISRRSEDS